ncbi:MAG TPA: glycosyltransferase [Ktedonobacterales bacterium]|nr:glycosyltransferase [Ktedonobacterales bacterium]
MDNAQPLISVVIPTYRRPELLERCLRALLEQDIDPSRFEVIVADDAANEATRCQVARMHALARDQGFRLRYIPVTGAHGPAAARNVGWRAARGQIIAFTDDDCVPTPGWLRAGLAAFGLPCDQLDTENTGEDGDAAQPIDGISGRVIVPLCGAPTDYQRNEARLADASFVTANSFYRRNALAAVGGFDERFRMAWREDSDLHFRLLEGGRRLAVSSDALVTHPTRPAHWGVSIAQQRKSMYNALLYKQHPRYYRMYIQPSSPWRYYATVAALGGVLVAALSRRRLLASAAAAVWSALTLGFCLRRLRGTSHAPRHIAEMVVTSAVIPLLSVFWRLRGALKFRVWFL